MGSRASAQRIVKRFREPSTWAGLSVLAVLFGVPPGTFELVTQLGIGLASVLAVALPEAPGGE